MLDLSLTSLRSILSLLHIGLLQIQYPTLKISMPSPSPYTKRRSPPSAVAAPPSSSPRSKGGVFFKSILFALFLLALPLFPSQAPEFVGETVLTKFWELIHLLFVGIAVAYGLFSRRSVESSVDSRTSRVVVEESSLSYVSSFFHVSSEDSCDFRSYESNVSARGSVVVVNDRESESFNQVQAWNSQYFQGRSKVVVVGRPDYGLDGHVVHQPLGLPVRSLMSGLRDDAALEDSSCDEAVNDEVVAAPPSPPVVPWHSRPEMMAMGDSYQSNFQPLSVDETHYEILESRPSQSTVSSSSSSSRTSFESHTQNRFSPSRSVSEELLDSNMDEPVQEKSLDGSSLSSSLSLPPSPPPPLVTEDTHRLVLHSRHYSDGSLLEEDVRQELEGIEVRGRRKEIFSKKELGSKSLKLAAESSRKVKNKSRRSYPPDPISSPVSGADDSTTRRRDHDDDHMLEDNVRKGLESDDHNKLRVKKGPSHKSLSPSPPLVIDDTHKRALHSRRYSDGSLLEEDELVGSEVKGRRTEIFSKKELGSKSLKLTAESSRKGKSKSRRSYPSDADDSTTRRRDLQHNKDDHLLEDRKGLESEHNKVRVKKGRNQDSFELTAEASSLTIPAVDVPFQPKNAKASRRSSRGGRDTLPVKEIKRKPEDDFAELDKCIKKELPGDNKEVKPSSPRREPHSSRASSKVPSRGKSVRTIRSNRHGKDLKTDGDSSHDKTEAKAESHGRTKPRRQWKEELAIVLHQEKLPETKSEPGDDVREETEAEQIQLTLEEEEEAAAAAAWESQSNASHDHYEVDRKADEFIAKFREQIRSQKLHSGEQPRGGGGGSIIRNSHFR